MRVQLWPGAGGLRQVSKNRCRFGGGLREGHRIAILVTSIVDPRTIFHSRLHELLGAFGREEDVIVMWPGGHTGEASSLPPSGGLSGAAASPRGLVLDELATALFLPWRMRGVQISLVANYNTFILGLAAALLAKWRDVPVTYDLADDLPETAVQFVPRSVRWVTRTVARLLVRLNLRLSDGLTCTTETLAREFGSSSVACLVLPNGVDPALFRRAGEAGSSPGRSVQLVFVGALRAWFDFSPVFLAVRSLAGQGLPCEVVIAGDGPSRAAIEALSESLRVRERVRFLGPVPYDRVPDILAKADVCLLPFDSSPIAVSAFPLKLLEYMAARRPVISSPLPEVHRVAGRLIWYARTDSEYVEAIQEIVGRGVPSERLDAGVQLVREQYSWAELRNRLRAFIETLRDRKPFATRR